MAPCQGQSQPATQKSFLHRTLRKDLHCLGTEFSKTYNLAIMTPKGSRFHGGPS